MNGVHIRHATARSQLVLIPLLHKPMRLDSLKRVCRACNIVHQVKTIHLWVDDRGGAIVSPGVLADMRRAGMPDLRVEATLRKPPTLTVGRDSSRPKIDAENRRQTVWTRVLG